MSLVISLLHGALVLLAAPWWLYQLLRYPKRRQGLRERLGLVPARLEQAEGAIWVHAVSVGEVLAVAGLIGELKRRFPGRAVFVSTTTLTGQELARNRFGEENVFYFPLDLAFAVRPYLRRLKPVLVVLTETELWPTFIRMAHRSGARLAVVNARISDRSFPGYKRHAWLFRPSLRLIDRFLAQTSLDAERLRAIGAPDERVQVSGNLKFDIRAAERNQLADEVRRAAAGAPVVVCGSTVEGEEELVLDAFVEVRERWRNALLVLAPRHPERFDAVATLISRRGLAFVRRSKLVSGGTIAGGILLVDTIGELAGVYSAATVAFVGGSLVPRGGHNILEPAQFGIPTVVGPHTENFRDIIQQFSRADALVVCSAQDFSSTLVSLLEDGARRRQLGANALRVLEENRGATQRTLAALAALLEPAVVPAESAAR